MTILDYETLTELASKLVDAADSITNPAAYETEITIRLAARAVSSMASLRFRIAEIAEQALTQDPAATRRDLIDALKDAEGPS